MPALVLLGLLLEVIEVWHGRKLLLSRFRRWALPFRPLAVAPYANIGSMAGAKARCQPSPSPPRFDSRPRPCGIIQASALCVLCRFRHNTHWTGHKSRLDRDLKNRFGSRDYAAEELVAELGAAFLCAEFGFDDGDVRHAGYIATWIDLLKANRRAFFTAGRS